MAMDDEDVDIPDNYSDADVTEGTLFVPEDNAKSRVSISDAAKTTPSTTNMPDYSSIFGESATTSTNLDPPKLGPGLAFPGMASTGTTTSTFGPWGTAAQAITGKRSPPTNTPWTFPKTSSTFTPFQPQSTQPPTFTQPTFTQPTFTSSPFNTDSSSKSSSFPSAPVFSWQPAPAVTRTIQNTGEPTLFYSLSSIVGVNGLVNSPRQCLSCLSHLGQSLSYLSYLTSVCWN